MFHLLDKYEDDAKLNRMLTTFYSRVSNEVAIKHFFMDLSLEKMLTDMSRFSQFILDRPEKTYTDSPTQTNDSSIQVGFTSFKEICHHLVEVFKEENIEAEDIPKLATDIMEIIEESKAESSDRISTVYQVDNINYDHLIEIFSHAKIKSELDEENILNIHVGGSQTPIYLKLNKKHQKILFFGRARLKNNDQPALDKIIAMANEAYTFFPVSRFEEDGDFYLYAEHTFSMQEGVPTRLLIRIAKQFTTFFESALRCDKEKVLEV